MKRAPDNIRYLEPPISFIGAWARSTAAARWSPVTLRMPSRSRCAPRSCVPPPSIPSAPRPICRWRAGRVAIKGVPQRQHHARSVGSAGQPAAWCGPAGDRTLYHQSDVTVRRHHTYGGGDAEHVFALLALLGFQFAPRIPDLKSRRLYSFAKSSAYPPPCPSSAAA